MPHNYGVKLVAYRPCAHLLLQGRRLIALQLRPSAEVHNTLIPLQEVGRI